MLSIPVLTRQLIKDRVSNTCDFISYPERKQLFVLRKVEQERYRDHSSVYPSPPPTHSFMTAHIFLELSSTAQLISIYLFHELQFPSARAHALLDVVVLLHRGCLHPFVAGQMFHYNCCSSKCGFERVEQWGGGVHV